MYVYRKTEPQLWTVGFYDPDGKWQAESDHEIREEASKRVHYLNGGEDPVGELEQEKRKAARYQAAR